MYADDFDSKEKEKLENTSQNSIDDPTGIIILIII